MNIVLSTTVLASVFAPAVSFSYLDQLGSAPVAAAAPAFAAPAAPVAAAPAAPAVAYESGFAEIAEVAPTSAGYLEQMNVGTEINGSGVVTHVDTLNTGASAFVGGAGINTYAAVLPVTSNFEGGAGFQKHVDTLSPTDLSGWGAAPAASFAGSASGDGVSFTLETGDISGLVDGLGPGGTLRLSGSIDSVSYN